MDRPTTNNRALLVRRALEHGTVLARGPAESSSLAFSLAFPDPIDDSHLRKRLDATTKGAWWRAVCTHVYRMCFLQGLLLHRFESSSDEARLERRWYRAERRLIRYVDAQLAKAPSHEKVVRAALLEKIARVARERAIERLQFGERKAIELNKALGGSLVTPFLRSLVVRKQRIRALYDPRDRGTHRTYRGRYGELLRERVQVIFRSLNDDTAAAVRNTRDSNVRGARGAKIRRLGLLAEILAARQAPDRAYIQRRYLAESGKTLLHDARRLLGRRDSNLIGRIAEDGTIRWGELLYWAVSGLGTDERMVIRIVRGMPAGLKPHLEREFSEAWKRFAPLYERMFPGLLGHLPTRLWCECGGDTWFDIRQVLYQRGSMNSIAHEKTGVLFKVLAWFSPEIGLLERDLDALEAHARTGTDTFAVHRNLSLAGYARLAQDTCRELKHMIGSLVTNLLAAGTVVISVLSLTLLEVPLTSLMAGAAVMSISSRILLKKIFKGAGYHRDELFGDIGLGLLDGATLFLSRLLRQAIIRVSTSISTKLGLKTGLLRYIRSLNAMALDADLRVLTGARHRFEIPRAVEASTINRTV